MIHGVLISLGNPNAPDAAKLIEASHNLILDLFPAEDNYALSTDELCAKNVKFFVANYNGEIIGCGALAIKKDYGELKSMFVKESMRGQGIAQQILNKIIQWAKNEDLKILKLETGLKLEAAIRLYKRNGFTFCTSFGDYKKNMTSIFMTKDI